MPATLGPIAEAVEVPLSMAERAATIAATRGEVAERLVVGRLRAVVGPDVLLVDGLS